MVTTNRLFQDFISFTIDTDPGISGTSLSGPGLADLLVVASPDFIALTLDPLEVGGDAEIVWVSAHTSAATTATIVRGQEGTTGRAHAIGREVVSGVTAVAATDLSKKKATGGVAAEVPTHDHSAAAEAGIAVPPPFVGWQLHINADQVFDTGALGVLTDVIWQVEDIDSDGFHSGTAATVTIPAGAAGYYEVEFQGLAETTGAADDDPVVFYLDHDGTPVVYTSLLPNLAAPGIEYFVPIGFTKLINLAVGDVLKVINYRGGSNMDIQLAWQILAQGGPLTYFLGHRIAV